MGQLSDRLHGWKEIAAFLDKSVRTVQRWERDCALPIHRQGPEGDLIFAYRSELDVWVRTGRVRDLPVSGSSALPAGVRPADDDRVTVGPHSLLCDDRAIRLREGITVIGRADDANVQLLLPSVSRYHARIVVRGLEATLEDLDSRHGTWRGAARVDDAVRLRSGDEIHVGSAVLVYRLVQAADTTL